MSRFLRYCWQSPGHAVITGLQIGLVIAALMVLFDKVR